MAESAKGTSEEEQLSREMRAQLAAITGGLAPDDYAQAWWDWYLNVAQAPQKQTDIAHTAFKAITAPIWSDLPRGKCWMRPLPPIT
jgi:hypothetical protein